MAVHSGRLLVQGVEDEEEPGLATAGEADVLHDLRVPPGNRLEALKGDRAGQYSIRINEQWRVVFRWEAGQALDVCVVDLPLR